jgi:hypothetical protein
LHFQNFGVVIASLSGPGHLFFDHLTPSDTELAANEMRIFKNKIRPLLPARYIPEEIRALQRPWFMQMMPSAS